MIVTPYNDHECLSALSEHVAELVAERDPALVAIAEQHETTDSLVDWLRSLPQRDDTGDPDDGPKVEACHPIQRLDLANEAPNCFERSAIHLGAAELIDPGPERYLRTVETPDGLHTLPFENGEPVILDPTKSRNAIAGALYRQDLTRNGNGGAPVEITPREAVDWLADLADEPAANFERGPERARKGHRALSRLLVGYPLCVADLRDAVFVLALGEREARHFGAQGRRIAMTAVHAVDALDQRAAGHWLQRTSGAAAARNVGFQIDNGILGALGRIGGRYGGRVGAVALQAYLTSLGVPPGVYPELERELRKEGLSMGALGKPMPVLGSLGALQPEAIAGHWLAGKL